MASSDSFPMVFAEDGNKDEAYLAIDLCEQRKKKGGCGFERRIRWESGGNPFWIPAEKITPLRDCKRTRQGSVFSNCKATKEVKRAANTVPTNTVRQSNRLKHVVYKTRRATTSPGPPPPVVMRNHPQKRPQKKRRRSESMDRGPDSSYLTLRNDRVNRTTRSTRVGTFAASRGESKSEDEDGVSLRFSRRRTRTSPRTQTLSDDTRSAVAQTGSAQGEGESRPKFPSENRIVCRSGRQTIVPYSRRGGGGSKANPMENIIDLCARYKDESIQSRSNVEIDAYQDNGNESSDSVSIFTQSPDVPQRNNHEARLRGECSRDVSSIVHSVRARTRSARKTSGCPIPKYRCVEGGSVESVRARKRTAKKRSGYPIPKYRCIEMGSVEPVRTRKRALRKMAGCSISKDVKGGSMEPVRKRKRTARKLVGCPFPKYADVGSVAMMPTASYNKKSTLSIQSTRLSSSPMKDSVFPSVTDNTDDQSGLTSAECETEEEIIDLTLDDELEEGKQGSRKRSRMSTVFFRPAMSSGNGRSKKQILRPQPKVKKVKNQRKSQLHRANRGPRWNVDSFQSVKSYIGG